MADKTKIEWTDATWNPITGCSRVSPGCEHCYAERLAGTRLKHHWSRKGLTRPGPDGPIWTGEVRLNEEWMDQPLRWKKPRRVFVCAHADLFHENVDDRWIHLIFAVMAATPQHTYQVLTKRPERAHEHLIHCQDYGTQSWGDALWNVPDTFTDLQRSEISDAVDDATWPLPNVWVGVSAENKETFDDRVLHLLQIPAAVRWVSLEPLLAPIDASEIEHRICSDDSPTKPFFGNTETVLPLRGERIHGTLGYRFPPLDWVVVGGESGPGARWMDPDWARCLRDQCAVANIPFFMKQVSRRGIIPSDLMIREYPRA